MILTLTPNPALDVSGTVSKLVPNEKSYVSHEKHFPGGNGINAARIAHRLGAKVLVTGFLGGKSGDEFAHLLNLEQIPQHFIPIQESTRTNITVSLEKGHEQTRLSFPGPKIQRKENTALVYFLEHSRPDLLIIGGSLPPGMKVSVIKKIIHQFHQKEIPVFVDMPGNILKDLISSRPFFIKPNLTEFQQMTNKKISSIKDVLIEARRFSSHIPLQCISSVEGGALLVTQDHAFFGKIPKIKVQSTVGAGDSLVGALAYSYEKSHGALTERHLENMLRLGLAASCATLANKGLSLGNRAGIKKFSPKIMIKQID
jgi:1-phosphofructokinase family hexose kinase